MTQELKIEIGNARQEYEDTSYALQLATKELEKARQASQAATVVYISLLNTAIRIS